MANPFLSLRTKLRAWREDRLDRKIGGISLSEVRESRFQDLGAYPTMSAEYGAIEMMFREFPLDANDVFVDVGCGFGRVISWLLLKKSPCKKYYGVELDPDVAAITEKRFKEYPQVSILNGNILDVLPRDGTVFWLYNPFDVCVLDAFLSKLESGRETKAYVMYYCDYRAFALEGRRNWNRLLKDAWRNPPEKPLPWSIWLYQPDWNRARTSPGLR
jgi:SAM-dependent methyltransferase